MEYGDLVCHDFSWRADCERSNVGTGPTCGPSSVAVGQIIYQLTSNYSAIGVFRNVKVASYGKVLEQQIAQAQDKQGPGDLATLIRSRGTWTVE